MTLPSVLFFDAQFLMESAPVSATPTTFSSASSDTSVCSSDISTVATTLAGDCCAPKKLLHSHKEYQHAEQLYLTTHEPPQRATRREIRNNGHICSAPTSNSGSIRSDSLSNDELLPRPLYVLPHTAAPPKSSDISCDITSVCPTLNHVSAIPRCESRVQETRPQWPYGIDPSRLNKDLPELPKRKKRVWRSIRRTVSHLFQRHHTKGIPRPASHIEPRQKIPLRDTMQPSNSGHLKSSSVSLISPRSRISPSSSQAQLPGVAIHHLGAKPTPAYLRKQQLRRSRSFSGYPNALTAIDDERRPSVYNELTIEANTHPLPLDDDRSVLEDGEIDEVAAEAFEILREVQKTWKFAPLNEDDPAFLHTD